jgi:hypothetical protein
MDQLVNIYSAPEEIAIYRPWNQSYNSIRTKIKEILVPEVLNDPKKNEYDTVYVAALKSQCRIQVRQPYAKGGAFLT